MERQTTDSVRESYDKIADAYARHYADELQHKPLDRELLSRFAISVKGRGEVSDLGCGPGHIARYLWNEGVHICGLDLSPRMIDQARKLNPEISFRVGNMMALDIGDETLAGIVAFFETTECPKALQHFWSGHAHTHVSERHKKLLKQRDWRLECAEKIGMGFDLPKARVSQLSKLVEFRMVG